MTVPVLVFENLRKAGPVSVLVLSNMDEKPDRTGLPSTRWKLTETNETWCPGNSCPKVQKLGYQARRGNYGNYGNLETRISIRYYGGN